ncbi:MAG: DNA repair protein RecN [Lachnospiraceae bacterium]|jgi:DNA repair protein RecN (Recombination protein N)|nr:DNA repair protein RecN [Lachnospiraceae bacterium]
MLRSLHVKNLALIAEEEVTFTDGLNVLTGETGAGKSILIGSVNLALGAKADRTLIRTGEEYALVELVFSMDNEKQEALLREMDLPVEEDGMILVKRRIRADGSLCTVNGENVTLRQLREIASLFIDVYGQRESGLLLRRSRQLDILDEFAGATAQSLRAEAAEHCRTLKALRTEWEENDLDADQLKHETDLLDFEIAELETAGVKHGEDEELEERSRKMSAAGRLRTAVAAATELTDGEDGAADIIGRACRELTAVSGSDSSLDEIAGQLTEIDGLLSDFNRAAADYGESLNFDDEEFTQVGERLDLINHLKAKYGETVDDLDRALENRRRRRDELGDFDASRKALQQKIAREEEAYLSVCRKLSVLRGKAADEFSAQMRIQLPELNFMQSVFRIELTADEAGARRSPDPSGMDSVRFLISMNPGEEERPLEDIASGGELSRIMLALKTVFAGRDDIHTFIFDEIDAGISGQTAWKTAEKLGRLSADRQIILITHLPQIAAMEDTHFLIAKDSSDGRTFTHIRRLSEEESDSELARLLGGLQITDAVIANAHEMKTMAAAAKKAGSAAGTANCLADAASKQQKKAGKQAK